MSGLFGEFTARVEDSFRIRLPSAIAEFYAGIVYIKPSFEATDQSFETRDGKAWAESQGFPYLELHPADSINEYSSGFKTGLVNPSSDKLWEARDIVQQLYPCKIEKKQRRITLNQAIREHMNLSIGDELMVLAFGGYVELWKPEDFQAAKRARLHEK